MVGGPVGAAGACADGLIGATLDGVGLGAPRLGGHRPGSAPAAGGFGFLAEEPCTLLDVDQERDVAAHYNIRPLPDMWFISEKGEAIGNKPGYVAPEEMLPVLKFIQTDSYLKMSYQTFLESQP